MDLIITIDTEEDNWSRYSTNDNPVENIKRLVPLQEMFDRYGVRPTYLISYPVAVNQASITILKGFVDRNCCEIGMHCHPWNTPPFEEEINDINSMLCNLPEELVYKKLSALNRTIAENFGITPISFRAGRWGFGPSVARSLVKLGYQVDTSVSPFVDWRGYHGPDYTDFNLGEYRFNPDDIRQSCPTGALLEIPATVGFLQKNFTRCQQISRMLEGSGLRRFRLKGAMSRLGLLNKVWLSPELATASDMIRLAQRIKSLRFSCLNMSFHSTTLMAGLSPFVKNIHDEVVFFKRIEEMVKFSNKTDCRSMTLSQHAEQHRLGSK